MTPEARERFLVSVLDALSDPADAMTEGRPHKDAKARAIDLLGLHFRTMGRAIYVAEEMAVVYPNEPSFSPDVLAVLDVVQPAKDERLAWVVADEGRGLDFVLEVLHHGNRQKDLVDNVQRYARLSIPEYFVYDRARQQVHGYRLAAAGRYERVLPQGGRTTSAVLGLDLAIQGGILRFFQGSAELYGSTELIGRLSGMVEDLQIKADEAATRMGEAEARVDEAAAGLQAGILGAFEARSVSCSPEVRARVMACSDPTTLGRWLLRALTASAAEQAIDR